MKKIWIFHCVICFFFILDSVLAQTSPDLYEEDNTPDHAKLITAGIPQHHNFHEPNDVDWIMFFAESKNTYRIEAFNVGNGCDVALELYYSVHEKPIEEKDKHGKGQEEFFEWDCKDQNFEWNCKNKQLYFLKVINSDSNNRIGL